MAASNIIMDMRKGLTTVEEAQRLMREALRPRSLEENQKNPNQNMGWVNKVRVKW